MKQEFIDSIRECCLNDDIQGMKKILNIVKKKNFDELDDIFELCDDLIGDCFSISYLLLGQLYFSMAIDDDPDDGDFYATLAYYNEYLFIGGYNKIDVKKDIIGILIKGDQLNQMNCAYTLGIIYREGSFGETKSSHKSLKYFDRAMSFNNSDAYWEVGNAYFNETNYDDAIEHFQKGLNFYSIDNDFIEHDKGDFYNSLADCYAAKYIKGLSVDINKDIIENYNIAIKEDNAKACNSLGLIYTDGAYNQTSNIEKAIELFLKAIKKNNQNAVYNLGTLYFNKGDYANALKFFTNAYNNDPDDIEVRVYLAQCKYNLLTNSNHTFNVQEEIIKPLEKGYEHNINDACFYLGCIYMDGINDFVKPDNEKAYMYFKHIENNDKYAPFWLGCILKHEKKYDEAIKYFNKSLENAPKSNVENFHIAEIYKELLDNDSNNTDYQSKMIDNYLKSAHLGYGKAYDTLATLYEFGNYNVKVDEEKAINYFNEAIKLGYLRSYDNLAFLYEQKGDYLKAKEYYELAISKDELNGEYYFDLASLNEDFYNREELNIDNIKDIILLYEKAGDLGFPKGYNRCGIIYNDDLCGLSSKEKAIEYYEKAMKQDYSWSFRNMSLMQKEDKQYDEALININKAIEINNEECDFYYSLAKIYASMFDDDIKVDVQKNIIENLEIAINYGSGEAANRLGIIYDNGLYDVENDIDYAEECYKKAIEINPSLDFVYYNLGLLYYNDQSEDCIELFKNAVELNPNDNDFVYYYLYTLIQFGKYDSSLDEIAKYYDSLNCEDYKRFNYIKAFIYEHGLKDIVKKDLVEAKNYIDKALEYDQEHRYFLLEACTICFTLDDTTKALEYLESSYKSGLDFSTYVEVKNDILELNNVDFIETSMRENILSLESISDVNDYVSKLMKVLNNLLDSNSRMFIFSGLCDYWHRLRDNSEFDDLLFDFSPIVLSLYKPLELQVRRIFVRDFIKFLCDNESIRKEISTSQMTLIRKYVKNHPLFDDSNLDFSYSSFFQFMYGCNSDNSECKGMSDVSYSQHGVNKEKNTSSNIKGELSNTKGELSNAMIKYLLYIYNLNNTKENIDYIKNKMSKFIERFGTVTIKVRNPGTHATETIQNTVEQVGDIICFFENDNMLYNLLHDIDTKRFNKLEKIEKLSKSIQNL